jgi:hypothetical protein
MKTIKSLFLLMILCLLFCRCEKESISPSDAQTKCGDSITWIYSNSLAYTQIRINFEDYWGNFDDPNTGYWWYEQGTYVESPNDGGGIYTKCYLGTHYKAWALIDPVVPGTIGEWVFYEESLVKTVNLLDGVSWN